MPRVRRRVVSVPPPAVAKKRYEYDVAEPKTEDGGKTKPEPAGQGKTTPSAAAAKAAKK